VALRRALRKGTLTSDTRQTARQAAEAWLEKAKRGEARTRSGTPYKPSVLRTHEHDLKTYIYPHLGALRLSQLRRRDVQALVDRLVADGRSGSRVRGAVMPLRVICRHAIERDELGVNPTRNLRLPEASRRRERVATHAEAAGLLEALPDEQRALWATALYAGLRRGELRALRWADIDDGCTEIRVRRSWDDVEGE
jgi:integrase